MFAYVFCYFCDILRYAVIYCHVFCSTNIFCYFYNIFCYFRHFFCYLCHIFCLANIFCYFCNIFCYFCNIFCLQTFFVTFVTFFELVSTPTRTRTTTRTTKLLLGPLSVARGQKSTANNSLIHFQTAKYQLKF